MPLGSLTLELDPESPPSVPWQADPKEPTPTQQNMLTDLKSFFTYSTLFISKNLWTGTLASGVEETNTDEQDSSQTIPTRSRNP